MGGKKKHHFVRRFPRFAPLLRLVRVAWKYHTDVTFLFLLSYSGLNREHAKLFLILFRILTNKYGSDSY
jgi:hypothetical protein